MAGREGMFSRGFFEDDELRENNNKIDALQDSISERYQNQSFTEKMKDISKKGGGQHTGFGDGGLTRHQREQEEDLLNGLVKDAVLQMGAEQGLQPRGSYRQPSGNSTGISGTQKTRDNSPLGQFISSAKTAKTPSGSGKGSSVLGSKSSRANSPLGKSGISASDGMFAAALIQDAFKRAETNDLAQVQLATQHFAGKDLVDLNEKSLGGFDPVAAIAEADATRKNMKERDLNHDRLQRAGGGKSSFSDDERDALK